ncbi:MAG: hypothetical protein IT337_17565, partial [Thermomicrobiales bacterium]|nr:hypothetical protein [Thermomicrobiales bacterium]
MEIIAYDGYLFASGNYWAAVPDTSSIGKFSLQPSTLQRRAAGSLLTGSTVSPRAIAVQFGYTGSNATIEDAFQTLVGILDPMNENPRTL